MKGRTLFCVKLPASGHSHDFWVPDDMSMAEAARLICEAMELLEPDFFHYTGDQTIMYAPTGQIQQPSATVGQIGFVDGDPFIIV